MIVSDIKKNYKSKCILEKIDFEAKQGQCVGLLGGNGSGKSTLIGILAGVVIGLANTLFGWVPFLGSLLALIFKAIGALVDLYVTAGIVVLVLVFCKVIKE